jgi:archaellum component FlaC
MKEELKSLPVKELGLGIIIGLIIGIAVGYAVTPEVDITPFEERISELEGQVASLQGDTENKSTQIADLQVLVSEKDGQISELQSEVETKDSEITALRVQISGKNSEIADLQNQVSQLQSQVVELRQWVSPYTEGEWNLVAFFQGNSGLTTDYFYVAGPELRLNWSWSSIVEEYAGFSIYLYREGETIITEACPSLQKEGSTFIHGIEAAYYYLKISEANLDQWDITVEVWIPE